MIFDILDGLCGLCDSDMRHTRPHLTCLLPSAGNLRNFHRCKLIFCDSCLNFKGAQSCCKLGSKEGRERVWEALQVPTNLWSPIVLQLSLRLVVALRFSIECIDTKKGDIKKGWRQSINERTSPNCCQIVAKHEIFKCAKTYRISAMKWVWKVTKWFMFCR